MCGFVGVVRDPAVGPVTREELAALLPDLRHRGPDGSGIVVGNGVGLAATRLRIQGDERGDQPVIVGGQIALAFNGELFRDDQKRLRARLRALDAEVPELAAGDSALLAAAFAAARLEDGRLAGPEALPVWQAAARSMGALAVIDLVTGEACFGRDVSGVKPLHLLQEGRHAPETWFSSTLTPLLRVRGAADLDFAALAKLWRWQSPLAGSPFTSIEDVLPGTVEQRGGRGERELLYTSRRPEFRQAVRQGGSPRARLEKALQDASREAADVDGPVALFLSGGLDSAAVAAFCGRSDVLALTGRFAPSGGDLDESAAAAEVARALGLRHEVLVLEDRDLVGDLEDVIRALEVPVGGPASLALWRLARRARAHGRVVLTGTGGDEFLGGYARTALALGRAGPWTEGYEALAERMRAGDSPCERALLALDRRGDLAPLFDLSFREALTALGEPERRPYGRATFPLDGALALEQSATLRALLHVEDRVLMAHGLEGRPVFCFGDVPDAALVLPEDQVIGPDGEGKVALRAILKGRIPESVRTDRRKRGFPTPFGRAARGAGRERAEAILGDRRFRERGWWDVKACRALLDEERPPHDRALFALLSWETWARLFVDGDAWRSPAAAPSASSSPAPGAPGK